MQGYVHTWLRWAVHKTKKGVIEVLLTYGSYNGDPSLCSPVQSVIGIFGYKRWAIFVITSPGIVVVITADATPSLMS